MEKIIKRTNMYNSYFKYKNIFIVYDGEHYGLEYISMINGEHIELLPCEYDSITTGVLGEAFEAYLNYRINCDSIGSIVFTTKKKYPDGNSYCEIYGVYTSTDFMYDKEHDLRSRHFCDESHKLLSAKEKLFNPRRAVKWSNAYIFDRLNDDNTKTKDYIIVHNNQIERWIYGFSEYEDIGCDYIACKFENAESGEEWKIIRLEDRAVVCSGCSEYKEIGSDYIACKFEKTESGKKWQIIRLEDEKVMCSGDDVIINNRFFNKNKIVLYNNGVPEVRDTYDWSKTKIKTPKNTIIVKMLDSEDYPYCDDFDLELPIYAILENKNGKRAIGDYDIENDTIRVLSDYIYDEIELDYSGLDFFMKFYENETTVQYFNTVIDGEKRKVSCYPEEQFMSYYDENDSRIYTKYKCCLKPGEICEDKVVSSKEFFDEKDEGTDEMD